MADQTRDLLIRDDREREVLPELEAPTQEVAPEHDGFVEQALAQEVSPDMSPAQAAELLQSLPQEQHERCMQWLSEHMGGLYATAVGHQINLRDSELSEQMEGWAGSALDALEDLTPETEQAPLGQHHDPIAGEVQLESGDFTTFSAHVLDGHTLRMSNPQGLGLSFAHRGHGEATMEALEVDLRNGDVSLEGNTTLTRIDQALLSAMFREVWDRTRRVRRPTRAPDALENREVWTLLSDAGALNTQVTQAGIHVGFGAPLTVQLASGAEVIIDGLNHDFASGQAKLQPQRDIAPELHDALQTRLAVAFAEVVFQGRAPAAMLRPGYTLGQDAAFRIHLQQLAQGFAELAEALRRQAKPQLDDDVLEREDAKDSEDRGEGGGGGSGGPGDEEDQALTGSRKAARGRARDDIPETLVLWAWDDPMLGRVEVCADGSDRVTMTRDASGVAVEAPKGLRVCVEDAAWTRELRITALRYTYIDASLALETDPGMSQGLLRTVNALLRSRLLPRLPGFPRMRAPDDGDAAEARELVHRWDADDASARLAGHVSVLRDDVCALVIARGAWRISAKQGLRVHTAHACADIAHLRCDMSTGTLHATPTHDDAAVSRAIEAWAALLPARHAR